MKLAYSILKSIFTVMLISQSSIAYAEPIEGKHYDIIENDFYKESLGVEKFFSLACQPCKNLSRMLPTISKKSQQHIHKTHVVFDDATRAAATLYYSAAVQVEDLPDNFINELFMLVQVSDPITKSTLSELFHRYDLTPINELTKQQQDQVNSQLSRSVKLTAQAEITQVPSLIVHGKYKIKMRSQKSLSELAATIQFLVDLK